MLLLASTFGALAFPGVLLFYRILNLFDDFIFFIIYGQAVIYLHLAPTLWHFQNYGHYIAGYGYFEIWALLLFEVPFTLLYLKWRRPISQSRSQLHLVRWKLQLLSGFTCMLSVVYLYLALRNNFFYTRFYGYGSFEVKMANMPFLIWGIIRLFQSSAVIPLGVIAIALILWPGKRPRVALLFFATSLAIYLAQSIVNTRLKFSLDVAFFLALLLMLTPKKKKMTLMLQLFAALFIVFCAYRISMNIRYHYQNGITLAMLNPVDTWKVLNGPYSEIHPSMRLNGIDIMARIRPAMQVEGLDWGHCWLGPLSILYYELTFQRSKADVLKLSYLTTPKRYLLLKYTNIKTRDYPDSSLADMYGNFGLTGFLVVALCYAAACAYITNTFFSLKSPLAILFALVLLHQIMLFEHEFYAFLFSWLRYMGILPLIYFLLPFSSASASPLRITPQADHDSLRSVPAVL